MIKTSYTIRTSDLQEKQLDQVLASVNQKRAEAKPHPFPPLTKEQLVQEIFDRRLLHEVAELIAAEQEEIVRRYAEAEDSEREQVKTVLNLTGRQR